MDTSTAKNAIFARLRQAQGRPPVVSEAERAAVADYLARHPAGPRPALGADLKTHFIERARHMASSVEEVAELADVPAAAARYLDGIGVARHAVAWASLDGLDWAGAGLAVDCRPPRDADLAGITGCFCAVAETGTLLLLSGPQTWASGALLPESHIAIVPASRIVAGIEDAFALVRAELGELPRAANFISGPSRTGDIEQTIVLGAHGPYRVHLLVVAGA